MTRRTKHRSAVLTTLGCILFASVVWAWPGQDIEGIPSSGRVVQPPPPAEVSQTFVHPQAFASSNLVGWVRIDTRKKKLSLRWSYDDATGERAFHNETFDLNYWPTAAAHITDQRLDKGEHLVVAGKRSSNGHTVLERWDLSLAALPDDTNSTTVQVTTLVDQAVQGKSGVRVMAPTHGVPGSVYVHDRDSRDLYLFDVTTLTESLQVTPGQVPQLGLDSVKLLWGGRTQAGSYAYVYQCNFSHHTDGGVVLFDDDSNGTFDRWTPFTSTQWSIVEAVPWDEKFDG